MIFVAIDTKRAFTRTSNKIHPPVKTFLLCTTSGDLSRSKKLYNWMILNDLPLLPFLTKAVILYGKPTKIELLNNFFIRIV